MKIVIVVVLCLILIISVSVVIYFTNNKVNSFNADTPVNSVTEDTTVNGDSEENKDYIIFDCDMGCMGDDALALSLLLANEPGSNYKILGITLGGGNNFIRASYNNYGEEQMGSLKNTQDFLEKCGRTDIPVFAGTDYPAGYSEKNISEVADWFKTAEYISLNNGWGAIHFFENLSQGQLCDDNSAADFLVSSVKEHPGSVVIFATGPTMNIARAVEQDEIFAENVKAVYYMGGAYGKFYELQMENGNNVQTIGGANVTPYAEYNVLYDPLSFYRCITAGFKAQYICPGELSIDINTKTVEKLREANTDNALLADIWLQIYDDYIQDYPYWDPTTVYAYLCPDGISVCRESYITVNTDRSDKHFGETTAVSPEEYDRLPETDKEKYGRAVLIEEVKDFWGYAVPTLCSKTSLG